jgi:tRNA threonylcarbamoyladenosine biosynthesis protein TsaE
LGAGKTCLTKGIARGLGIREEVTSPTYTIISEYAFPEDPKGHASDFLRFYHIDAYRLKGDDDFNALGGDEVIFGEGISVIEWSERLPQTIPQDAVTVEINLLDGDRRSIDIEGLELK